MSKQNANAGRNKAYALLQAQVGHEEFHWLAVPLGSALEHTLGQALAFMQMGMHEAVVSLNEAAVLIDADEIYTMAAIGWAAATGVEDGQAGSNHTPDWCINDNELTAPYTVGNLGQLMDVTVHVKDGRFQFEAATTDGSPMASIALDACSAKRVLLQSV